MRRTGEQIRIHRINRLLYFELKDEYDDYHSGYCGHRHDISEIREHMKIRQCVEWLRKHDLPFDSAMGLFANDRKIRIIRSSLNRWIGNSDESIGHFLTGIGNVLFDEIREKR